MLVSRISMNNCQRTSFGARKLPQNPDDLVAVACERLRILIKKHDGNELTSGERQWLLTHPQTKLLPEQAEIEEAKLSALLGRKLTPKEKDLLGEHTWSRAIKKEQDRIVKGKLNENTK